MICVCTWNCLCCSLCWGLCCSLINWICSLNTLNKWKKYLKWIAKNLSDVKKPNSYIMNEVHKNINWTLWDSDIMKSILRLHMMITKTSQNVHKICFQVIWMTFTCDLKIDLIKFKSPYVKFIFMNLMHSEAAWLFVFWHIIHNWFLVHFLLAIFRHMTHYLNHLSPSQGYFIESPSSKTTSLKYLWNTAHFHTLSAPILCPFSEILTSMESFCKY